MQNENYLGVECPKCGRMFKAEILKVVFSCNSNFIGTCPRCGTKVEAHLTQRAADSPKAGDSSQLDTVKSESVLPAKSG